MGKLLKWLLTATCSAGILLSSKAYSQSYIQQDAPSKRKEVLYVVQVENPLSEEQGVKLNITSALEYVLGQDTGTAYLNISAENGRINKLDELWLIFPSYVVPSFEIKKGHDEKWTKVKETAFKEAAAYFMDKLPGIMAKGLSAASPAAGLFAKGILDIDKEVGKKQERERRMDLESLLDIDENLASLLKRPEDVKEKTLSVKIPFTVQRQQLEIETSSGDFVTGTYPSSRTNPADDFYVVFSLSVLDNMNISGKAENVGMNWRNFGEVGEQGKLEGIAEGKIEIPKKLYEIDEKEKTIRFTNKLLIWGNYCMINGKICKETFSSTPNTIKYNDGIPEIVIFLDGKKEYGRMLFKETNIHGDERDVERGGYQIKGDVYIVVDDDFIKKNLNGASIKWGITIDGGTFGAGTHFNQEKELEYHPNNIQGIYVDKINFDKPSPVDESFQEPDIHIRGHKEETDIYFKWYEEKEEKTKTGKIMLCTKCGHLYEDGKKCPMCGEESGDLAYECLNCGGIFGIVGEGICPHCGTKNMRKMPYIPQEK